MRVVTQTVVIREAYFDGELTRALVERSMTVAQLAEMTGHSVSYIKRIALGGSEATQKVVAEICAAMGMTIHQLCGNAFDLPTSTKK